MSRKFSEPDFAGVAELLTGKSAAEVTEALAIIYREGQRNALEGVRMGFEAARGMALRTGKAVLS